MYICSLFMRQSYRRDAFNIGVQYRQSYRRDALSGRQREQVRRRQLPARPDDRAVGARPPARHLPSGAANVRFGIAVW
jgi:hypothetical protein